LRRRGLEGCAAVLSWHFFGGARPSGDVKGSPLWNRLSLRSRGTCPPILRSSTLPEGLSRSVSNPAAYISPLPPPPLPSRPLSRGYFPLAGEDGGFGAPQPASRNMTDTVASHPFRLIAARSARSGSGRHS
jgi:hypothetical protein